MSATSRAVRKPSRRAPRRIWIVASFALIAVAAVVVLAVVQSAGSGTATLPPRVATGSGRVLGSAAAPVTIVEYADFQCPVCKRAETTIIPQIEKDYIQTGKVKLEFRMFPFLGQESFDAAQAAEAARDQGKFWQYHDALFNAQGVENSGAFSYANLVKLAQQVGLDVPLFEKTLTSNTHLAAIQQERDAASAAGVNSTPTFFIGGQKIVGLQPYATFQAAIDAALKKAGQ
ncbi:MAG TPA: DsbA family protein [Dehalococcoidia bacterium]|nr:DsbA family protein [Dehalococcoidia bacterium]